MNNSDITSFVAPYCPKRRYCRLHKGSNKKNNGIIYWLLYYLPFFPTYIFTDFRRQSLESSLRNYVPLSPGGTVPPLLVDITVQALPRLF